MSMTWMFRREPPPFRRAEVGRQAIERMDAFCRSARSRLAMRACEEAFLQALENWAYYALADNKPQTAQFVREMQRLSDRSQRLSLKPQG